MDYLPYVRELNVLKREVFTSLIFNPIALRMAKTRRVLAILSAVGLRVCGNTFNEDMELLTLNVAE